MAKSPYQKLLEEKGRGQHRSTRRSEFSPEVRKARNAERARRYMAAKFRANEVLRARYPEEYNSLLEEERAGVDAERGPLPGDPDYVEKEGGDDGE